jgi:hypothetical protein
LQAIKRGLKFRNRRLQLPVLCEKQAFFPPECGAATDPPAGLFFRMFHNTMLLYHPDRISGQVSLNAE